LVTTGSNTFVGTQTITGSLFISSDLVVQGSSSLQNITASAVSIGTNIVNLNTANPAIRYAGLSIGDSGSIGSSGSFLYDSVQDEMIFIHRGVNTTVTSSVVLMGPQTFDNIGSETYPTLNIVQKGTGNEHLVDSCIFDNGTTTCIKNNLVASGTITGTGICINGGFNLGSNACINYTGTYPYTINIANGAGVGDIVLNAGAGSSGYETKINLQGGTNGYAQFSVASAEIMRITSCGYVGIGATPLTTTAAALQIEQAQSNIVAIRRANCSNTGNSRVLFQAYNASGTIQNTGIVEAGLDSSATNGYIGFYAGTAAMNMKITSTGLIGMNQLSPTYRLEICSPASDCVLGLMSANGVNIDMVGYGTTLTYPQSRIQMNDDGFYGGNLSFFTKPNGAQSNGLSERMRISSCGKVGIGASSPRWLLEICCNTTATGGGGYPAIAINNPNDAGYSAYYFFKGSTNFGGMELSNATCHLFINSLNTFAIQTNGTERLRLNQNGGFGTQLCNFCLNGTYQTLVTVENGSYGLMMLSSCLGGGTYALYNVFNNAGTTTANLIHGNNIPVQISGNAVQVRSSNSATYCDMRSSYIRFY
jgi:hypothetical protein